VRVAADVSATGAVLGTRATSCCRRPSPPGKGLPQTRCSAVSPRGRRSCGGVHVWWCRLLCVLACGSVGVCVLRVRWRIPFLNNWTPDWDRSRIRGSRGPQSRTKISCMGLTANFQVVTIPNHTNKLMSGSNHIFQTLSLEPISNLRIGAGPIHEFMIRD
jgi:hypothetical protein